jgi:hypothetical protein
MFLQTAWVSIGVVTASPTVELSAVAAQPYLLTVWAWQGLEILPKASRPRQ